MELAFVGVGSEERRARSGECGGRRVYEEKDKPLPWSRVWGSWENVLLPSFRQAPAKRKPTTLTPLQVCCKKTLSLLLTTIFLFENAHGPHRPSLALWKFLVHWKSLGGTPQHVITHLVYLCRAAGTRYYRLAIACAYCSHQQYTPDIADFSRSHHGSVAVYVSHFSSTRSRVAFVTPHMAWFPSTPDLSLKDQCLGSRFYVRLHCL